MAKRTRNKKTVTKKTIHHAELDKVLSLVVDYAEMMGFPVPPAEKMEKMIKSISKDVQLMFTHNKRKKQMQGGDILILMLKIGLIAIFVLPLIKKLLLMNQGEKMEKHDKTKIETKSMVD